MTIEYRTLEQSEIERFQDIDRSEVIDEVYHYRNGALALEKEHYDMAGFPPGERDKLMERQRELLRAGGVVFGAFDGPLLVGITSLENIFLGTRKKYLKMDILFVSKNYRGKGIARTLVRRIGEHAKTLGADALYISATPSKHTVEFYVSCGARLVDELDPELFKMEPKDIHLELALSTDTKP
jgi:predicted N-acetyltransferase YhbS